MTNLFVFVLHAVPCHPLPAPRLGGGEGAGLGGGGAGPPRGFILGVEQLDGVANSRLGPEKNIYPVNIKIHFTIHYALHNSLPSFSLNIH